MYLNAHSENTALNSTASQLLRKQSCATLNTNIFRLLHAFLNLFKQADCHQRFLTLEEKWVLILSYTTQ